MASNRSAGGDGSHGSWAESPYGDEPGSSPVPPPPGGVDGPLEAQGPYGSYDSYGSFESPGSSAPYDAYDVFGTAGSYDGIAPQGEAGPSAMDGGMDAESVNPAEPGPGTEYEPPARGRHRVPKQRGGSMARSGAVLGVGVIAAVGAGGMASAQERPAAISVPDVSHLPGAGPYLIDDGDDDEGGVPEAVAPAHVESDARQAGAHQAGAVDAPAASDTSDTFDTSDAGEALRARILQQADHQRQSAGAEATHEVQKAHETQETHKAPETHEAQERAAADAQRMAAAKATADRKARGAVQAAHAATARAATAHPTASQRADSAAHAGRPHAAGNAPKARADAAGGAQASVVKATGQAQAEARRAAERITAARAKRGYVLPVSSYRITARFGQAGGMWSHRHTGTDFAAPTGTPVKAVHGGTITHAGWAGSYGYRIVLRLDDGTEVWFCHLSSIVRTKGKVAAGQVIGRVGATGNVTGAHLHLEVRPHGGHPVDPLHWLRSKGLRP
ncbi:peptidoglycan DD-metalloendopeptidase family protein [Streptomyces sp. NPDC021100]|uniref:peptidoglycan DD-metalloendopeptidase family protein n=1 Tax=Streptomyces sp. NPDC021100 TaxID=3365114 RepID=UPI003799FEE9